MLNTIQFTWFCYSRGGCPSLDNRTLKMKQGIIMCPGEDAQTMCSEHGYCNNPVCFFRVLHKLAAWHCCVPGAPDSFFLKPNPAWDSFQKDASASALSIQPYLPEALPITGHYKISGVYTAVGHPNMKSHGCKRQCIERFVLAVTPVCLPLR